jgi:hypothetical protein
MFPRRRFLQKLPLSALALSALSTQSNAEKHVESLQPSSNEKMSSGDKPLMLGPPVVQHPSTHGATIVWRVGRFATGWIEWGMSADNLDQKAISSEHGLVDAASDVLAVELHSEHSLAGKELYYRVCTRSLNYAKSQRYPTAYELSQGEITRSSTRSFRLPDPMARKSTMIVVNDTHENKVTIAALADRIEKLQPELLLWNGDSCNDFDIVDDPAEILLSPGAKTANEGGWASTRPLLFVPGNHDVRGQRARELQKSIRPWNGSGLPYNFAFRHGPIAIVGLDTGEDKPDAHPNFAGTAAYQPYRKEQGRWLAEQVKRDEIRNAPFRLAFCHIPLRGLPNTPDGTRMENLKSFAQYCGDARPHWLPSLHVAEFNAVLSGHTHEWRIDDPTDTEPLTQIVGGGPHQKYATLTWIEATASEMTIILENLEGKELIRRVWKIS